MNKLSLVLATAALATAPLVQAHDDDNDGVEYAQVVSADPVEHLVRVNDDGDECREEPVTERVVYPRRYYNPGAPILGAIIGGVIGHQFGGGVGRDVATAAGAVIGANAGAEHSGYYDGQVVERTRYESVCRPGYRTHLERQVVGYEVAYRWHGHVYHTRTRQDPGSQIRVRVAAEPVNEDDDRN
jgi:uncharacterized protein YcfJ